MLLDVRLQTPRNILENVWRILQRVNDKLKLAKKRQDRKCLRFPELSLPSPTLSATHSFKPI